jgi:site-specific recombinase XerD
MAADELGFEETPLWTVPWDRVGAPELAQMVDRWHGMSSNATIRLNIYAVRGVVESCVLHHLVHPDQYEPMRKVRAPKDEERLGTGKYIKEKDRRRLLQSCDDDGRTVLGIRDKAMLGILFGSGAPRAEATQLQIQNLKINEGRFQVVGKGDHLIDKYLAAWAIQPLRAWLVELERRGIHSGAILYRISKGGKPLSPLSSNGLWRALGNRCRFAGINVIKPHDARSTFACDLIRKHGLKTAKTILGHANVASTAMYDISEQEIISDIFRNEET